jgi:hypothetical protein
MNTATVYSIPVHKLIGALAACVLTVVLLGEISQVSVQAAQRAVLLQA